jgi:hypothetical protein
LIIPALAFAAPITINGTIQGFNCVSQGRTCPIGQEDPLVATENVFVLLTPDNKYYFVPNVDRAVMARHVAEPVQIKGDLIPQQSSIRAQSIAVNKNGQWQVVWTPQMQKAFSEPGIGPYPYKQP